MRTENSGAFVCENLLKLKSRKEKLKNYKIDIEPTTQLINFLDTAQQYRMILCAGCDDIGITRCGACSKAGIVSVYCGKKCQKIVSFFFAWKLDSTPDPVYEYFIVMEDSS